MDPWPPKHRNLAAVLCLVVLAAAASFLFIIRPRTREAKEAGAALGTRQRKLKRTGWPLDPTQLEALMDDAKKELEGDGARQGLKQRLALVIARGGSMFEPKIREQFGDRPGFLAGVSRLDFEEEFNRLVNRLKPQDVYLCADVLDLGQDKMSPYTYQLVLQVWTVDMISDLALHSGLDIAPHPTVTTEIDGRTVPAANIAVLPMTAYYLGPEDRRPYLLEFPVRMTLTGSLEQASGFLRVLNSGDNFFPVKHMELSALRPGDDEAVEDGQLVVRQVQLQVECCTFFPLHTPDETKPKKKRDADEGT